MKCVSCLSAACAWSLFSAVTAADSSAIEKISASLSVIHGSVNGARLEHDGKTLAIYGDPRDQAPTAERGLLTHSRRDVLWAARSLTDQGVPAVGPEPEAAFLQRPQEFWQAFEQERFHNYAQ